MSKQIIIIRKDLNMRKGKCVAQGCHASTKVVEDLLLSKSKEDFECYDEWRNSGMTKICVGVDSERELGSIYQRAIDKGMPASIITDAGHTEFGGVPTKTAAAIGPWDDEEIDEITGDLKLL